MKILHEVRKEDDYYYQGAFWIIGDSMQDILSSNYHLCCHKMLSDFSGNILDPIESKRSLSHQRLWNNKYKDLEHSDKPFNYYPRGRVGISNGVAYINLIEDCDTPKIIADIINEYEIGKLTIKKELVNAFSDGGHRAHLLN